MGNLSIGQVMGDKFSISKYMAEVRRVPDVSQKDIAYIENAFSKEMQKVISHKQGAMMIKWDYRQLKELLKNVSESGLKKKFAEATIAATSIAKTKVKHHLAKAPGFNSKSSPIKNEFIRARLNRQSTGLSIYKLVSNNLNYTFDADKGSLIGFVGPDVNNPLTGSRDALLAPLVEGKQTGGEPEAPPFPVAGGVNWHPYQAKYKEGIIGGGFSSSGVKIKTKRRVARVKGIPFLDVWATHAIDITMKEFMERGLYP